MREEGVREIVASRATTRVAPTFHVEQTQHVGATLVVALRNFAKILRARYSVPTPVALHAV